MTFSINTNILSLMVQEDLQKTQRAIAISTQRLSSGLRINFAADDPAGSAIGSRLAAQIKSLAVAQRNGSDAISMLQSADSGMAEIDNMVSRMRELAVEASNGTLTTSDRAVLDAEFQSLDEEISRVANNTAYNSTKLLNGSTGTVSVQIGVFNSSNDRISITAFTGSTSTDLAVNSLVVTTATSATSAITSIDTALASVATIRGNLGSVQNRLNYAVSNLGNIEVTTTAAYAKIMDADVATEQSNLTRKQILAKIGISVLAQANTSAGGALSLL